MPLSIRVAARSSPLSRAQVNEVFRHLAPYKNIKFETIFLDAIGDIDLLTPLNTLAKTDFFTQNIDQMLIDNKADIAIHSAKDLPEKIPQELEVIAITQGVDPRDSLVSFKYNLKTLPFGAIIGACSDRRVEGIKKLRNDVSVRSIRGTINHRIEQLKSGDYDAIILAEAGLIRLNLDVPREIIEIPVAPLQGKLAIVARKNDFQLKELFKVLDSRLCG